MMKKLTSALAALALLALSNAALAQSARTDKLHHGPFATLAERLDWSEAALKCVNKMLDGKRIPLAPVSDICVRQ